MSTDIGGVADRLLAIRTIGSDQERDQIRQRMVEGWLHMKPNSVLVAVIGNHWEGGSWEKTTNMVIHTSKAGIHCGFSEMQDRCFQPYDALGTMRNEAIIDALNEGFEWICYVDADILPEPDTLIKLIAWQMPIVAPFVAEPGTGKPLHGPERKVNTGLQHIKWCVLSMLLIKTSVFNAAGPRFWGDAVGADEGYHFKTLARYGHTPMIDTNTQLIVSKPPTYPLTINRMTWDERQEALKKTVERLKRSPDRRPIDPRSPFTINGEYMPFATGQSVKEEVVKPMEQRGIISVGTEP